MGHVPYQWIIGSLAVGLALIIAVIGFFVCSRSSISYDDTQGSRAKDPKGGKVSHKFRILQTTSFCCVSRSDDWRDNSGESSDRHMNIPKGRNF